MPGGRGVRHDRGGPPDGEQPTAACRRKPGSVGLPAGPEIAILEPTDDRVGAGEIGEVAIRGENVFAGYEANAEANAAAFSGGWFRTGDRGDSTRTGISSCTGG